MPTARAPGGQTLIWIASDQFGWRFPEHLQLFFALLDLERSKCVTTGNPVGVVSSSYSRIAITAVHLLQRQRQHQQRQQPNLQKTLLCGCSVRRKRSTAEGRLNQLGGNTQARNGPGKRKPK